MVPHRSTNWAILWLTSQIGRDAVLSQFYGRGWSVCVCAVLVLSGRWLAGRLAGCRLGCCARLLRRVCATLSPAGSALGPGLAGAKP